jgi:glycosidase
MKTKSTLFLTFLLHIIIFSSTAAEKYSIQRVEPSNWWVGMKNTQLLILVYGQNIGLTEPVIQYPSVKLDSTVRTGNNNYLFLYLNVPADTKPGKFEIQFKVKSKLVARYNYELLERKPGSSERKSFDASDVIYLLMPDRFSNGDPSNDSSPLTFEKANRSDPNGRHGGDIQGIINHLDYIKDLGFTALWSTPLLEDNMENYSYHTYAITDYYKIDPRYGTNQDYVRLSDELHKHGMKLIMDVVTNHCGSNHWWMKDLPTADWVHQFDKFTRSNYQISTIYDPYASEYDKNLNFNGWFDTSMPDLNQDNPLLLKYLIQNTVWWIEFANLDGLRVDTYPYNSHWKIAEWTKAIRYEYPNINIAGECWVHSPQEIAYWQTGTKNFDGYDSQLPTVMDFALHDVFTVALNENDSWNSGLRRFYNHFTLDYVHTNPMNILVLTENHDTRRFNEVINADLRKFKIAYTILFTIRGIPQFYYGTEVLMTGDKSKGDGDIRRDFPGGWPGDNRNAFVPEGRTATENESYNFIKKLLNWRKDNPLIHSGKTMQYISQDNCYIYFRYNETKTIMVAINIHDSENRTLDTRRFAERMQGFTSGYEVISEKTITDLSVITIPPKTAMIIELKK